MYISLFVGVLCWSLRWYALFCVLSSHLDEEERAGCLSCYCKCYVALPHDAVGWSAVCDCGISLSY